MTRIERLRTMATEEMAREIIKLNFTDEYCKGDCKEDEDCLHELECCIRWLKEEQTK